MIEIHEHICRFGHYIELGLMVKERIAWHTFRAFSKARLTNGHRQIELCLNSTPKKIRKDK